VITINELKERLAAEYDEEGLLDLLGLTNSDIVEAFSEVIEEKQDYLIDELTKLEIPYESE